MVTDLDGHITQNVVYIPYGEVFVEERNGSWASPYLFNSKELDEETGLYYYGARYLDPTGEMWLSVDPKWEDYSFMTPYNYCAGNPVKFIDPDGREKIVVVGNEGDGPKEDFKSNGDYRYGKNKRFFLQAGIDIAKEYKRKSKNEQVTMLVYEGQYSQEELDLYKSEAEKNKIHFFKLMTTLIL